MSELSVDCPDKYATAQVAAKIAGLVKNGGVIELVGDVGSGKTTFVKALAKALGYDGEATSPSFALHNTYSGQVTINHFDLYRLEEPVLAKHELEEAVNQNGAVTVIEWAKSAQDILPEKRIIINFLVTGNNARELKISLLKRKD